MPKIILIGAGGHCNSCIDVIKTLKSYEIVGLVDNNLKKINKFDYPILGNDRDLIKIRKKYKYALITIGQIKTPAIRITIFNKLRKLKYKLPVIISTKSYVSKKSKVNEGSIIMHGCIINSNALIGKNCIINTSAIIEHDSKISNHCHISTGSIINGEAYIGEGTFIGSRSVIREGVKIGKNCIVGAGSIIKKDLNDNEKIL